MKKIVLAAFLILSFADAKPATKSSIMFLMEKTNSIENINLMFEQMFDLIKRDHPEATKIIDEFKAQLDTKVLVERIIRIYQKYYTEEDLVEINKFYDSQVGQKLLKNMPMLLQDSMMVGEKFAKETFEKLDKKLQQECKECQISE